MNKITLIAVGTIKDPYICAGMEEYKKRIAAYAAWEEIILKEVRIPDEEDATQIDRALQAEGDKILSRIPKGALKVALCVEGKQYSSPDLAALLDEKSRASGHVCLIIGSSHGLSDQVKNAVDLKISVSKLTFPHQLMRLMLTEIVYRVLSIQAGAKYHK